MAQANSPTDANGKFLEERVLVRRKGGEVEYVKATEVDYMDVSPRQMVSVATAMIPFLEHDDANRALMGRTCSVRPYHWCAARLRWSVPVWNCVQQSTPATSWLPTRLVWWKRFRPTTSP